MPDGGGRITYTSLSLDETIHPRYEKALDEVESELLRRRYPSVIGGREVYLGAEFEERSPIDTSILVGRFQRGSLDDAREAISSALVSFREWGMTDWRERVRVVKRVADLLERDRFRIAAAITYEVGKTRLEALAEVHEAIDAIRYYCGLMEKEEGYVKKMGAGGPGEDVHTVARPYGVWVVISPFNFPVMLANGMIAGALLTGNTVVWKPAEEATLSGIMLYNAFIEAGVPGGVLNLLTGPGEVYEDAFVGDKRVAGLAFTGSREVGMKLYRRFAELQPYPKPVVLETGSKNPTIVTERADLEKAVEGVVRAAFGYGGQKCSATSRLYVQDTIYQEFIDKLVERTSGLIVGDPREKETFMGPLINERAYNNFARYVRDAVGAGGRVLVGGSQVRRGALSRGFYVEPTVVDGVPHDHYLFKEELFVPILLVDRFRTLGEAIEKANDTEFGLTAGLFSEDEEEIREFFERIEFGVVYANRRGGATTGAWPGAQSFVGWKASGATGVGVGGPYYLINYFREQARTVVREGERP